MKKLLVILFFSSLFSCLSKPENKTTSNSSVPSTGTKQETIHPVETYFVEENDSVVIPSFEIKLSLSDSAEHLLRTRKESVIVKAYYSGVPKDTSAKDYKEWGKIFLPSRSIELMQSRIAKFNNIKISKDTYKALADKNIEVLINVFSGRRSTDKNLLNCNILQDKISNIKDKSFTLAGKLIGE